MNHANPFQIAAFLGSFLQFICNFLNRLFVVFDCFKQVKFFCFFIDHHLKISLFPSFINSLEHLDFYKYL
jgi:hypothetical protein